MLHNRIKHVISSALAIVLTIGGSLAVGAVKAPDKVYSPHVCVYNTEYSKVVYARGADEKVPPGPTAKTMTAILALEHFSKDRSAVVTVSPSALNGIYGSAVIGLKSGETIPAYDLIHAVLIGGYSDAANALACAISGSTSSFAVKMNKRAKELGAVSTLYQNPTGLDEKGAYTTAYDTAVIAAYAVTLPDFTDICAMTAYTIPATNVSEERKIYTRNMLILNNGENPYHYSDARGVCAGFTDDAGYCAVSTVVSGFSYSCAVLGAEKNGDVIQSYKDVKTLLSWAKNNFEAKKLIDTASIIAEIPVELSSERNYVTAVPKNAIYSFMDKDADVSRVERSYALTVESLEAPVKKGTSVGTLTLTLDGEVLGSCELVTKLEAERSAWLALKKAISGSSGTFWIAVLLLAILCTAVATVRFLLICKKAKKRKLHKSTAFFR